MEKVGSPMTHYAPPEAKLRAGQGEMASKTIAMASNSIVSDGLQPNSDGHGLHPNSNGLQSNNDGLQPNSYGHGLHPNSDGLQSNSNGLQPY